MTRLRSSIIAWPVGRDVRYVRAAIMWSARLADQAGGAPAADQLSHRRLN